MVRSTNLRSLVLPVLLTMVTATGCFFDPDIDDVVSVIEQEIAPARIEPETTVRIGRALMSLARVVAGLVPDEEAHSAKEILSGVNEVHVGVYDVYGLPRHASLHLPDPLRAKLEAEGWGMVIKMDTADSQLWLMAQARDSRVHGAYVIVLEREELVVVKLKGNLSRTIDLAVKEAMRGNQHMMDPVRNATGT